MKKIKFYEFSQTNSGGYFKHDDHLTHWMIIEADNQEEAEKKAFDMGVYYDGVREGVDCACCGDRWYEPCEMIFPYRYGTFEESKAKKISKDYGIKYDKTNCENSLYEFDLIFENPEQYLKYMCKEYGGFFEKGQPEGRIFYNNGKILEI